MRTTTRKHPVSENRSTRVWIDDLIFRGHRNFVWLGSDTHRDTAVFWMTRARAVKLLYWLADTLGFDVVERS